MTQSTRPEDGPAARSNSLERLERSRARVEADRAAEDRAFRPSENLEALVLRVIGGWENLVGEVNFTRFHAAGRSRSTRRRETTEGNA